MSLIKKVDVERYFAERRAMRLGRTLPLGQRGAAGVKSSAKREKVPASAEALILDHSSPSAVSAPIPIGSESGRSRLLRLPGSRHR